MTPAKHSDDLIMHVETDACSTVATECHSKAGGPVTAVRRTGSYWPWSVSSELPSAGPGQIMHFWLKWIKTQQFSLRSRRLSPTHPTATGDCCYFHEPHTLTHNLIYPDIHIIPYSIVWPKIFSMFISPKCTQLAKTCLLFWTRSYKANKDKQLVPLPQQLASR